MYAFKTLMLKYILICTTCLLAAGQDGSGSADQNALTISLVDNPVTLPVPVLKQLIDILDNSTGLFPLWTDAFKLANVTLKKKVSVIAMHSYVLLEN